MALLDLEYQNIFTRVQVRGPAYAGVSIAHEPPGFRQGKPAFSHFFGQIGDAQVGPIYLGWIGLVSLIFGWLSVVQTPRRIASR